MELESLTISSVENPELQKAIQARQDDLTKPPGSLGRLEDMAMQYCLCRNSADARINNMAIYTFAGDHGVCQEGITAFPSEVTAQMVLNMALGGAAISVMCQTASIDYHVVDVGSKGTYEDLPGLIQKKVAPGTRNFKTQPAMTARECREALQVGIDLAGESKADLLGIGEMGIGNTTASSALYSLLLGIEPEQTVGPGAGTAGEALDRKKQVVAQAVAFHRAQWDHTPFDALRRVGGFEIAGMCGMLLGAASMRIPVVVDGFISSVAALTALRMKPEMAGYLFFAHTSAETFHQAFLRELNITAILDLGLRLGEGTGAALAMQIIRQAMACYHNMATFSSAGVSKDAE